MVGVLLILIPAIFMSKAVMLTQPAVMGVVVVAVAVRVAVAVLVLVVVAVVVDMSKSVGISGSTVV